MFTYTQNQTWYVLWNKCLKDKAIFKTDLMDSLTFTLVKLRKGQREEQ